MMDIDEFPGCCGASVILDFGHNHPIRQEIHDAWGGWIETFLPSKEEIDRFVKRSIEEMQEAFLLAILTPSQNKVIGPILKDRGFKVKGTGNNEHHYNKRLTLYVYTRKVKKDKK